MKKAEQSDLEVVLELRFEMLGVVNEGAEFDEAFRERTREYFTNGEQTTVLTLCGDKAVGCATICYQTVMPTFSHQTGNRAHIMNVFVRKEHRRNGLAREMMEMLLEDAKKRGVTSITLDATESGKPLYKALGFGGSDEYMELNNYWEPIKTGLKSENG